MSLFGNLFVKVFGNLFGSSGGSTFTLAHVRMELYEVSQGTVRLDWTELSGGFSYYVRQNGTQLAASAGTSETISGLLVDTDYAFEVIAISQFATVKYVSNTIHYSYSSENSTTATYMTRIKPYPSTNLFN